jgi:hypothetical protein
MQAEHAANPPPYQGAYYADDDVDDNPETAPFDNPPGERPGNTANNQPKDDSMRNGFHCVLRYCLPLRSGRHADDGSSNREIALRIGCEAALIRFDFPKQDAPIAVPSTLKIK